MHVPVTSYGLDTRRHRPDSRATMPRLSLAKLERHLYAAADRLRQEGLDAAIYKDYTFGLLFLKRCSDVFEAEREKIVGIKVEQGGVRDQVEETYGEDPDYYDGFFVPPRSRWAFLNQKLNDAGEPFGSVLDKALGGLSETNDSLEHVLDHISFMRTQGNKRVISDEACKDLVRHFSRQRLRNEVMCYGAACNAGEVLGKYLGEDINNVESWI